MRAKFALIIYMIICLLGVHNIFGRICSEKCNNNKGIMLNPSMKNYFLNKTINLIKIWNSSVYQEKQLKLVLL